VRGRNINTRLTLGQRAAIARGAVSIEIQVGYKRHWGFLQPSTEQIQSGFPASFEVTFWGDYFGKIYYTDHWTCSLPRDQAVIDKIGEYITAWYE
jgi:hypothetical protein